MAEPSKMSFDAALMMALRADAQKELDALPTPEQLEELYPDTSQWDDRMATALRRKQHHPVLKRVLVAALMLVVLTLGALAVSADFRKAVYTRVQKFLPIETQLTYQVDGEPLEQLPDEYSDHYVPTGFESDDAQGFERTENFLHVYSSKETGQSYTIRCSIIQPGQQSLFDNEHTTYTTVKIGDADASLGTSSGEDGQQIYTLNWESNGIAHASTGDGILTSLKMMEVMLAKKKPMSELAAPLKIYPQVLENVRVTDKKAAQNDPAVQEAVSHVAEALGDTGRILVRESGTEPVVRVMVEAPDHDTCQKYVDEVVNVICEKGYKA